MKINVYLISCTRISEVEIVLVYAISDQPDTYSYRMAHLTRDTSRGWSYQTIAAAGCNHRLPESATRCNQPIEQTFTSAVEEAVRIAQELELLA